MNQFFDNYTNFLIQTSNETMQHLLHSFTENSNIIKSSQIQTNKQTQRSVTTVTEMINGSEATCMPFDNCHHILISMKNLLSFNQITYIKGVGLTVE